MSFLRRHSRTYNPRVVAALAECIHILPTGACVDLSDGCLLYTSKETIMEYTKRLAQALHVIGLINIQFIAMNEEVYVLSLIHIFSPHVCGL